MPNCRPSWRRSKLGSMRHWAPAGPCLTRWPMAASVEAVERATKLASPQRRALLVGTTALLAALCGARPALAASLVHAFGQARAAPLRVFAAGPPAAVLVTCLAPERLL